MTIGPREAAHREHADALLARKAALRDFGINSEAFRLAEERLVESIKNLPTPPPKLG